MKLFLSICGLLSLGRAFQPGFRASPRPAQVSASSTRLYEAAKPPVREVRPYRQPKEPTADEVPTLEEVEEAKEEVVVKETKAEEVKPEEVKEEEVKPEVKEEDEASNTPLNISNMLPTDDEAQLALDQEYMRVAIELAQQEYVHRPIW